MFNSLSMTKSHSQTVKKSGISLSEFLTRIKDRPDDHNPSIVGHWSPHKLPALAAKKCAPSTAPVVLEKAHNMMIHMLPAPPEAHLLHHQTYPSCTFSRLFRNWELLDNVVLCHRHRSILTSRRYNAICTSSAQNFSWFFDTASEHRGFSTRAPSPPSMGRLGFRV